MRLVSFCHYLKTVFYTYFKKTHLCNCMSPKAALLTNWLPRPKSRPLPFPGVENLTQSKHNLTLRCRSPIYQVTSTLTHLTWLINGKVLFQTLDPLTKVDLLINQVRFKLDLLFSHLSKTKACAMWTKPKHLDLPCLQNTNATSLV